MLTDEEEYFVSKVRAFKRNDDDQHNDEDDSADLLPTYTKYKYDYGNRRRREDDPETCNTCLRDKANEIIEDKECLTCLLMCTLCFVIVTWLVFFSSIFSNAQNRPFNTCSGKLCQIEICKKVENKEITGNLCMDMCYSQKRLDLPKCAQDLISTRNTSYEFYNLYKYESTFICPKDVADKRNSLKQEITVGEFEKMVTNFIQARINHSKTVEKIVERIFYMTDANHDMQLDYAEAATLWSLLNTKQTFYMLMFGEHRPFIPQINDFCGNFIEIEEITDSLSLKSENSLLSVFTSNKWQSIRWEYRIKISMGILDFYVESSVFNPNDEFGADALYLCSPIEDSFGYNFFMEAKLISYDHLLNGRDLVDRLSSVRCAVDSDCSYTRECTTECVANKCSHRLDRPQLVNYCMFLRRFLADQDKVMASLEPLIDKCLQLRPFYLNESLLYEKSEMPLTYERHQSHLQRSSFWNSSIEYSLLIAELKRAMWGYIKLVEDPKKKKKN